MTKKITIAFLLLLFVLAACTGNDAEVPSTTEDSTETTDDTTDSPEDAGEQEVAEGQPFTNEDTPCKTFNLLDDVLLSPVEPNLAPVTEDDLISGAENAKFTFIVYSNFTCGHCGTLEPILNALLEFHEDDMRVVFRYVTTGGKSTLSAQAVEAANIQGNEYFVELKDVIFANQGAWWDFSDNQFNDWVVEQAEEIGLDVDKFKSDMESDAVLDLIESNRAKVNELGIQGTPTVYVNGRQYSLYQERSLFTFSTVMSLLDNYDVFQDSCPTVDVQEGKDLQLTLSTTKGDIVIDLFEESAPQTVAYITNLINEGWYNNSDVFAVTDEFVLFGDPSNTLYGGPGYVFLDEASEETLSDEQGLLISYNRIGPGYNSGILMLTKSTIQELPGYFTVMGKISEGLDILNDFTSRDFSINPSDPIYDTIINASISEK